VEVLSLGVAIVMIVLYAAALFFGYRSPGGPLSAPVGVEVPHQPAHAGTPKHGAEQGDWSLRTALLVLAGATVGVVVLSELLIGAVEPVVAGLGVSEFFLGVILIPIVGNVAEHLVAVKTALQNEMDLSVEIAVASSLQIALFVAPALVFISLIMGNPLHLIFNQFELLALVVGVIIAALVSQDGESNWLEGAELLAVYVILGLAFFLLPV
jgi:Ca2+:H+ antiporter